ncbi:MAG: hypothetical protein V4724_26195 [Pseudomonadota bacterium]
MSPTPNASLRPRFAARAAAHAGKALLIAALAIPAGVALLHRDAPTAENRNLAPLPVRPSSWPALLAMPAQLDAWVNDHFGLRNALVRLNNQVRFKLFNEFPSIQMAAGQHGRYFLAAHGTNVPPFQALTNVCGKLSTATPQTLNYLNRLFGDFHKMGLQPRLLIVPSSPVVHGADVPAWLVPSCSADETPVTRLLADPRLNAEARDAILFPLGDMREIGKRATLYPLTWFHWSGAGLDEVARLSLTRLFGKSLDDAAPPLRTRTEWLQSDVGHLFPGVKLLSEVTQPDTAASQVDACYGGDCYPEVAEQAKILGDVSRFKNPLAPQRRLLIISDSYGSKISAWYARYYGTVEQVATNNIEQLSIAQLWKLKKFLFRQPADTDILFLYHDGGAAYDTLRFGLQRFH